MFEASQEECEQIAISISDFYTRGAVRYMPLNDQDARDNDLVSVILLYTKRGGWRKHASFPVVSMWSFDGVPLVLLPSYTIHGTLSASLFLLPSDEHSLVE